MTLKQLIDAIEAAAIQQPSVNMIVASDIFKLNATPDARYGVFAWTQGQHSGSVDSGMRNYQFNLFYVDRLNSDASNVVEAQSVGMETIDNILRTLDETGVFVGSYTFQVFTQRFVDECAGVFVNVTLTVPVGSICGEYYQQ